MAGYHQGTEGKSDLCVCIVFFLERGKERHRELLMDREPHMATFGIIPMFETVQIAKVLKV